MERTDTDPRTEASWTSTVGRSPSRYDVALGVIPLFLVLPAVSSMLAGVPPEPLMAVGAVACALVVVDVAFVNPPVGTDGVRGGDDAGGGSGRRTGR
jgi:hypothetical protein